MNPLPANFRVIHLELARGPEHPEGDATHGYDLVAPLDDEGRIDGRVFRSLPSACRVRRFRPNEQDLIGHLAHGPGGGAWLFDYGNGPQPSERGYNFRDEQFRLEEYVSIREDDNRFHTFRVASLLRP